MCIRDSNCTNGSKSYRKIKKVPEKNSELVEKWLSAGLIPLGRTNTPEFGLKGITEPELWGACRNPHDTRYSSGGSSGGSAASVAARIVPIAGASDGGGSVSYTHLDVYKRQAKVRGMTQIAKEAGIGREALYKALRHDSSPRFDTINRVVNALGLKITVQHA